MERQLSSLQNFAKVRSISENLAVLHKMATMSNYRSKSQHWIPNQTKFFMHLKKKFPTSFK